MQRAELEDNSGNEGPESTRPASGHSQDRTLCNFVMKGILDLKFLKKAMRLKWKSKFKGKKLLHLPMHEEGQAVMCELKTCKGSVSAGHLSNRGWPSLPGR